MAITFRSFLAPKIKPRFPNLRLVARSLSFELGLQGRRCHSHLTASQSSAAVRVSKVLLSYFPFFLNMARYVFTSLPGTCIFRRWLFVCEEPWWGLLPWDPPFFLVIVPKYQIIREYFFENGLNSGVSEGFRTPNPWSHSPVLCL